jgi:hypothetical protein
MGKSLKTFGKPLLAMDSTVSPTSKPAISLVNFPLKISEIEWLKQQSKLVGEDYRRLQSEPAAE